MKTFTNFCWVCLKIFVILICVCSSMKAQDVDSLKKKPERKYSIMIDSLRHAREKYIFNTSINRFKWEKRMASASVGLLVISGASYLAYENSRNNPAGPVPKTVRNWQKAYQWSFYGGMALGLSALVIWQIRDKWVRPYPTGMKLKINGSNFCEVEVYPVYAPNKCISGQIGLYARF